MSSDSKINSNENEGKKNPNKTNVCPLRHCMSTPPPVQKTPGKHSADHLTSLVSVRSSGHLWPSVHRCHLTQTSRTNTRVEVSLTDTSFCELNKQEATLQNERDIFTGPRPDVCDSILTRRRCQMPRFVMDKIIFFFSFFFFFGQLAYQVSWFFLPFFIFEEKWRAGRKILHSDESNSLWKFFFFFFILLL